MKSKIKGFALILGCIVILTIVFYLTIAVNPGIGWVAVGGSCISLSLVNIITKKYAASNVLVMVSGCIFSGDGLYIIFDGQKYINTFASVILFVGSIFFTCAALIKLQELKSKKETANSTDQTRG